MRTKLRRFVDAYAENDLLTYASAISFQVISSLVPLMLFNGRAARVLQPRGRVARRARAAVRAHRSRSAFALMNEVVTNVLEARTVFWVTAGFVMALWEISGAMRAVMGAMNRIYDGGGSRRSWRRRMMVSTVLGLAVGVCLLSAAAVVLLGPVVYGDVPPAIAALLTVLRVGIAGGAGPARRGGDAALRARAAPAAALGHTRRLFDRGRLARDVARVRLLPARHRRLQLDLRRDRHGRGADRLPVRGRRRVPGRRPSSTTLIRPSRPVHGTPRCLAAVAVRQSRSAAHPGGPPHERAADRLWLGPRRRVIRGSAADPT